MSSWKTEACEKRQYTYRRGSIRESCLALLMKEECNRLLGLGRIITLPCKEMWISTTSWALNAVTRENIPLLFLFASLLFTAICKASSDRHFALLHFFFLGMVLIPVSCTMS